MNTVFDIAECEVRRIHFNRHFFIVFANLVAIMLALVLSTSAVGQVPVTFQYFYDELGQLVAVVDGQGHTVIYQYDTVGNLLAIRRIDAAGPVAITFVNPTQGGIGQVVDIAGVGFSAVAAQNQASFNGVAAPIIAAATNSLRTQVPNGASTGPITVTTPLGSAVSPTPFVILVQLTVTPSQTTQVINTSRQFTATVTGTGDQRVTWKVNGQIGGAPIVGTITADGLYTAPASVPTGTTVTIQAVSIPFPTVMAQAAVTIGQVATGFVEDTVSVNIGPTPPGAVDASAVSVMFGASAPGSVDAAPVTVANAPVISAVSPASGVRGTPVALTLTGLNFTGATSLVFLFQGVADSQLSEGNLSVNGSGTQLTATVTIGASAQVGSRVVVVQTPSGNSTGVETGSNMFAVLQQ